MKTEVYYRSEKGFVPIEVSKWVRDPKSNRVEVEAKVLRTVGPYTKGETARFAWSHVVRFN